MRRLIAQLAHDWELLLGVVLFGLIVLLAVFGGWLWREDPLRVDILNSLLPPDLAHPMGTDDVGRDVLARFIRGAQVSMGVAISVTIAGTLIGGTLGLLAGLIGGWFDVVVSRIMDAILAFPPLILAMAVAIGLGQGIVSAGIGVILAAIPWYFRLLRSEVLRLRTLMYVESAQALGASSFRLIRLHILPQTTSTIFIRASSVFGFSILTLAALGFVGLGIQPPTPEWGTMITEGLAYALTGQWWLGFFPGLGIFILAVSANLIADRLRDIYDPKSGARMSI
ncbi:ABC transporter permease subunit [Sinorhizobium medicae]|uniref:ABC transporter permease n=1 Tax=Sinorhizobium medicae TaxID=110321 RepID=UPI000FD86128|nr:ABC transporter permease [Sinorhizobium medicae]MDX0600840.1 ABC transporter permease subunit [Sinorhizobium medicae]MDX0762483.1 ABC transporter permease subunit [Sinorhizobium medicae]MDX0817073.1 ABC transporter permease subunit [Sinorhizobium medicae]MDX0823625.1 ABC transporter permease subunit [Sinorhizobium medicae]MDX0859964.1 ABC transporter permease subunit [Sinorhizobium medicae]